MSRISFKALYTSDGMRGALVIEERDGEGCEYILTVEHIRALSEQARQVARVIEWDRADWLCLLGPPHHLVRKGTGKTLCGGEVDERRGHPWNFERLPHPCKKCFEVLVGLDDHGRA